jgi:hypothetical protein
VRLGGDPGGVRQAARGAPIMAELFDRYLSDHARPNKKASSLAEDERLIKDYLKPAFARRKVVEVKRAAERVAISPSVVAAIRLLALTGTRKGEILGLQWA